MHGKVRLFVMLASLVAATMTTGAVGQPATAAPTSCSSTGTAAAWDTTSMFLDVVFCFDGSEVYSVTPAGGTTTIGYGGYQEGGRPRWAWCCIHQSNYYIAKVIQLHRQVDPNTYATVCLGNFLRLYNNGAIHERIDNSWGVFDTYIHECPQWFVCPSDFPCPATAIFELPFDPVSDTYIDQSLPDSNFGSDPYIQMQNAPGVAEPSNGCNIPLPPWLQPALCTAQDGLLKFSVNMVIGTIVGARLQVCAQNSSINGGDVSLVGSPDSAGGNSWDENTVTWNTAPPRGEVFASFGPVLSGFCKEVSIPPYLIELNGTYSFRISSPDEFPGAFETKYNSREVSASNLKPKLIIVLDDGV